MSRQISGARCFTMGVALAALAIGGAAVFAVGPSAPHVAPSPPVPPAPPTVPALVVPPGSALGHAGLSETERAELREAVAETHREAMMDRAEAMREAAEARRQAMAAAVEMRNGAFAKAAAERDRAFADAARAMRAAQIDVRAVLIETRGTIVRASGMREEDRRAVLSGIDRALSGLDRKRAPTLQ